MLINPLSIPVSTLVIPVLRSRDKSLSLLSEMERVAAQFYFGRLAQKAMSDELQLYVRARIHMHTMHSTYAYYDRTTLASISITTPRTSCTTRSMHNNNNIILDLLSILID